MNQDIEKILNAPPDDFERVLYRAEEWLHLLTRRIAYSAEISATLDKSYDLLLTGLAESDDDGLAARDELADKTRAMVRQYRGFRDADTTELLRHVFAELFALHAINKRRTP